MLTGHCHDLGPLVHGLADRPTISLLISHYKDSGPLADTLRPLTKHLTKYLTKYVTNKPYKTTSGTIH